jgi:hypothetical protein
MNQWDCVFLKIDFLIRLRNSLLLWNTKFNTIFTKARHWTLSQLNPDHSFRLCLSKIKLSIILPLRLHLQSGLFTSSPATEMLSAFIISLILYVPSISLT